jgi:hypothetical protein
LDREAVEEDALSAPFLDSRWSPTGFTGSYPPGWKGWHFMMRAAVIPIAVRVPFVSNASIAYSEQVGTNLQAGGQSGEIYRRYKRMKKRISAFTASRLPVSG